MFRALLYSSSGGQNFIYSIWYRHNCRWPSGAQVEARVKRGLTPTSVTIQDAV